MATGTPGSDFSVNQPLPPSPQQTKASHGSPHGLNSRSCVICRRRKVKCDKKHPCTNCAKAGSECVFPAPGRAPRKPRPGGKVVSEREAELLKRLRRLEGVVEELSGQVELEAARHSPSSDNSSANKNGEAAGDSNTKSPNIRVVGMDEGTRGSWIAKSFRMGNGPPKTSFTTDAATLGMGKLVLDEGKSRYVASTFWASVSDELDELKEMLEMEDPVSEDSDSDNPVLPSDAITEPNHQSFILGYSSSDVNLKELHPLPSQIPFYWQTFLENVHPLTMILHRPTMTKTIKEVAANLDHLRPSTEVLMFSIYFSTVVSMSGEEVRTNFGVDRETLIRQYRFGVEQGLAKASFLNTDEIVTIQALVLFLVCVRRHDDTQFVWTLTGLALRLAHSLGLHRDGSRLGASPFDTEMRRRLWWQLCILDSRASEDHGSDPSILDLSFDTEYPLSINDDDISPEDTKFPMAREGVSEMIFTLVRCEICSLLQKLTYVPPGTHEMKRPQMPSLEEKEALVKEASLRMEDKYLKYCDISNGSIFWVSATVARLIITKLRLLIYHPLIQPGNQMNLDKDLRDRLFMASIEILEYSQVLRSESTTKQWGWLFHTYVQWHAIAYILGELGVRENSITVERAWRAMHGVFNAWGGSVILNNKHMLWQPMRQLMMRARRKREENEMQMQSTDLGIDVKYYRSQPTTYTRSGQHGLPQNNEPPKVNSNSNFMPLDLSLGTYAINNTAMIEPRGIGMSAVGPEQVQLPLPGQGADQQWEMGDYAVNVDMVGVGDDFDWNGWDEIAQNFAPDASTLAEDGTGRPPAIGGMGGMGNWW